MRYSWMGLHLLIGIGFFACNHRLTAVADDAGFVQSTPDGWHVIDYGEICDGVTVPITMWNDPRGNLILALPEGSAVESVAPDSWDQRESAIAVNHNARGKPVAGLAVTRGARIGNNVSEELSGVLQSFRERTAGITDNISIRTSGIVGKSYDGVSAIKEAIWEVTTSAAIELGAIRDYLIAAALQKPATYQMLGPSSSAKQFVIKITAMQRLEGSAITAAVITAPDYEKGEEQALSIFDDLGNGTIIGKGDAKTRKTCDLSEVNGRPLTDIIWVIDESGSMVDNRKDITRHADQFFNQAVAMGLDFRMGVTDVKSPTPGVILGKLCSAASSSDEAGGEDRFLLPTEKEIFSQCVLNPPYNEHDYEYGLTNALWAIKRHLPRAVGNPEKIREGAKLAVIIVTDEAPQELKAGSLFEGKEGFLEESDLERTKCQLSPEKQWQTQEFVKPFLELISGSESPESKATVHLISGVCGSICDHEMPYGYIEIAQASSGQVADICQKDLSATLQVIIENIAASASPHVLRYLPISSTLTVELDGQMLARSRSQGFIYQAASNSITFVNVPISKGSKVNLTYQRFE